MSTEQLVAALSEYKLNPTEIADILWLALRQPREAVNAEDETSQGDEGAPNVGEQTPPGGASTADTQEDDDSESREEPKDDQDPSFDIAPDIPSGTLPRNALPIFVPDAGLIEETLPLVRALKPLLKQIASATASHVNEAETVDRIAETDIWSPVLQPDREPWFEVALVIDGSAAMSIWQRLIQDIQRLLRCYGSFRDFRIWKLVVTDGQVGICAVPDQVARNPKALLAPDSRRLTLVFSDCTADYWWDGTLQPVLALWGNSMPTAIWQVLPDWMWKRTALGVGEYVAIRNRLPGATNPKLNPIYLSLRPSKSRRTPSVEETEAETSPGVPICVPVITTDGDSIGAWSRMLAGDRRQSTPGFVLPATGWERFQGHPAHTSADPSAAQDESDELLEQFRLKATPEARRLAALLSAAPVITLPVMRLIRASMLQGTSPLPVAEVFLGGLLQRAPDQPHQIDAELVQYDFAARDRLLGVLPKVEAIQVIEAVSQYVAERLNLTLTDFRALLLSPDLKAEADAYGLRAFARVTAQILRKLGKEYETLAAQFESPQEPIESDPVDTTVWPDFPIQTFEYEVAEFVNVPPFEPFNFTDAQFDQDAFPPPLQAEGFTIITFEAQLESFEFNVATLHRRQTQQQRPRKQPPAPEWEIQRQPSQAYRFVENLPGDIPLEMVAIPAGTFLMGSPDDEPERNADRESPQHEVTVESFFMGRYPVTQAQWRVVAAMPEVTRKLDRDPSRFKGDNRPVEKVSWDDAVEFCARLSAHTGREYRLPSEAEWEYACRAGTTTPFHFGETISSELADYDGTTSYADGPRGEHRGETTAVDQFDVANAFGLTDMHGNIFEWCQDHWHDNYDGAPTDGSAWQEGGDLSTRVRRGGSWFTYPRDCRSASRSSDNLGNRNYFIGFRVCCSAPRT
jgi:formylglycine-generating enzyme required for sulfatase activity